MKRNYTLIPLCLVLLAFIACSNNTKKASDDTETTTKSVVNVPQFNADSAYQYVKAQVDFGPRVPNTKAHVDCGNYLADKLTEFGAKVTSQYVDLPAYTGTLLKARNIIGSYKPDTKKRIALFSHWDSRPWADADPDAKKHYTPILGANDGASGVGVLLEVARHLGQQEPKVGVDILFVDAEDYGQSSGFSIHDESWALGTQYWVAHLPYAQDSLPRYAVLLDMVGGIDAKFHREYFSNQSAPGIVDKVWSAAVRAGYGDRFVNVDGGAVIDDHFYVNQAGIPAIDIIESKNEVTKSFNPTWHTAQDNMDNIDRRTLKAVGQTVLNVVYSEKP